jgi:hypothetical protein
VLKNNKPLLGSKIRIDENFMAETRKVRSELIPYIREVKRGGYRAFLKRDKLKVKGGTYDRMYSQN